jgi:AcrR family transcriptional regulator
MAIQAPSRRRAIEDVASGLFRERGYAATSIRDIARALDIRGASVYAHVTSKEDMLWAIVERAARAFEEGADRALAECHCTDPSTRLAALTRAHVGVITADPELASVFVHEWRHLSPGRRQLILVRRDAYQRRFRDLIDAGITEGAFTTADLALAATFILSALNGIATWYRPTGRLDVDSIVDHFADYAVRSVGGRVSHQETDR